MYKYKLVKTEKEALKLVNKGWKIINITSYTYLLEKGE